MDRRRDSGRRTVDVVGAAEAAAMLGVTNVTVSRMIRDGRLRPDVTLACGPIFRRKTIERAKEARQ